MYPKLCPSCDGILDEDGITCPPCDAAWTRAKAEAAVEYLRDNAKCKVPFGAEVVTIEKIDELKSGQWWLWSCDVEMPDGRTLPATIQGSEHETDPSTL